MTDEPSIKISFLFVFCLWQLTVSAQDTKDHLFSAPEYNTFYKIDRDINTKKISLGEGLLNKFYYTFEPGKLKEEYRADTELIRCATPIFLEYKQHKSVIPAQIRSEINSYMTADIGNAYKEYRSPSQRFEIWYTTTGPDSVSVVDSNGNGIPDYVEKTALYADYSWKKQVGEMQFRDFSIPGEPFIIYFLKSGNYGGFNPSQPNRFYVHPTFEGFPPNDDEDGDVAGALKATIAHEMKHAIQYATNQMKGDAGSLAWVEMDATMMEEVIFPEVNDYHHYLKSQGSIFSNPHFSTPGAYFHATWGLYFVERFGIEFWVDAWEVIAEDNLKPMMDAVRETLHDMDQEFAKEFIRNYMWHYASGSRWMPDYGFAEGDLYPDASVTTSNHGIADTESPVDRINHQAARFHQIIPADETGEVAFDFHFDIMETGIGLLALKKDGTVREFISSSNHAGNINIKTGWNWNNLSSIGITLVNFSSDTTSQMYFLAYNHGESFPLAVSLNQNYPNPFNPTTSITFTLAEEQRTSLVVFDLTGREVARLADGTLSAGSHTRIFNSNGLSSGLYLYRLQTPEGIKTKKMMLIK